MSLPHAPILRFGDPYTSMDKLAVADPRDGSTIAELSHANAGLIRRDLRKGTNALRDIPSRDLLAMCAKAADLFMNETLPLGDDAQSPQQYVEQLSITSGLPHTLCRANMDKIVAVLSIASAALRFRIAQLIRPCASAIR